MVESSELLCPFHLRLFCPSIHVSSTSFSPPAPSKKPHVQAQLPKCPTTTTATWTRRLLETVNTSMMLSGVFELQAAFQSLQSCSRSFSYHPRMQSKVIFERHSLILPCVSPLFYSKYICETLTPCRAIGGFLPVLTPLSCILMGLRGSGLLGASDIEAYYFFSGLLMVLGNTFPTIAFTTFGSSPTPFSVLL